jgi:hypothetical protein
LLWISAVLLLYPGSIAGQATGQPAEVKLKAVGFQEVLNRLFGTAGMDGLLKGNQPFELRAKDVDLTPQQAEKFLTPNGMDIAALAAAVQKLPGTEVKIEGLVNGAPFELKVEAGEIKLEGLALTQTQLDSLFDRLQMIQGIREVKIEALVNGQRVEVKLEGNEREIEREGREHHRAEKARHEGHDRDHKAETGERVEVEHEVEREGHERVEHHGRMDKAERVEITDHLRGSEKIERVERMIERPERIEKVEHPEKPERIERSGHH